MRPAGISLRDDSRPAAIAQVRTYAQVFPARPEQVRAARRFMSGILDGCPAAGDTILCLSELAANAVIHSSSSRTGGAFTVRAEVAEGSHVRIEVHDNGGPWSRCAHQDDRPHGLDIVASLAAESGVDGGAVTGWVCWVKLNWPGSEPSETPAGRPEAAVRG